MSLPWTARTRRIVFVAVAMFVLTFPLIATLVTRARVERSGTDVVATVIDTSRKGDDYLVGFRFPEEVDPDQDNYSAEVERASYESAVETKTITVRVLDGRPEAHRVEGEIHSKTPYVVVAVTNGIVLLLGLWWIKTGRRRPTVRLRALGPLEPVGVEEPGSLGRVPGGDVYEAVGTVLSTDDAEAVLDLGERRVVVALDGHPNPVAVGSPARAHGPMIG
jgi:hypothetical protein